MYFQNQQSFLESLAATYGIHSLHDWQKVSVSFIRNKGGHVLSILLFTKYKGLLKLYNNSLVATLQAVLPSFKLAKSNEMAIHSDMQLMAYSMVSSLFYPHPVLSNYRHPGILCIPLQR